MSYSPANPREMSVSKDARFGIVPGWIYRAIIRNRMTINDLRNYAKVREVMSLEDIAEIKYLDSLYRLRECFLQPSFDCLFFTDLSADQAAEFHSTIIPLSYSKETEDRVNTKLNFSTEEAVRMVPFRSDTTSQDSDCGYQFIPTAGFIYLVLNEGFETRMKHQTLFNEFVENYLKACYTVYSVHQVSESSLYKKYLEALSFQA